MFNAAPSKKGWGKGRETSQHSRTEGPGCCAVEINQPAFPAQRAGIASAVVLEVFTNYVFVSDFEKWRFWWPCLFISFKKSVCHKKNTAIRFGMIYNTLSNFHESPISGKTCVFTEIVIMSTTTTTTNN